MPPKTSSTKKKPKGTHLSVTTGKVAMNPSKSAVAKRVSSRTEAKEAKVRAAPVAVGKRAPNFALPDDQGRMVKLSNLKGKKVVLFFYPKDNTPGCTQEACNFRDGLNEIRKRKAVVFGVSGDSVASHKKFSEKFQFNFPLLSDESKSTLQAYGVWKEKSLYGRKFMGIERTTILINEKGVITHVFPKVKVNGHYEEVLEALK